MACMLLKLLRRWIEGSTAVTLFCGYALCVTLRVTLCVGIVCHCVGSALQHDGKWSPAVAGRNMGSQADMQQDLLAWYLALWPHTVCSLR